MHFYIIMKDHSRKYWNFYLNLLVSVSNLVVGASSRSLPILIISTVALCLTIVFCRIKHIEYLTGAIFIALTL